MNKENVLFGIIGVLLGCIVGFVFANTVNQRGVNQTKPPATNSSSQQLPPNHPPTGGDSNGESGGAPLPEVATIIKKAKDEPANFDAQMAAAKQYYDIQRLPEAIGFLQKAINLKPKDFTALSAMGNAQFDSRNFAEAERWYREALTVDPNSIDVRTDLGSTFLVRVPPDYDRAIAEYQTSLKMDPNHIPTLENTAKAYLQKGDRANAQTMLDRLAQADPSNKELAPMRAQLATPQ